MHLLSKVADELHPSSEHPPARNVLSDDVREALNDGMRVNVDVFVNDGQFHLSDDIKAGAVQRWQ